MIALTGAWAEVAQRLEDAAERVENTTRIALERAAIHLRDAIKRGIRGQAPGGKTFAALHWFTVEQRRAGMSARYRAKGGRGPKALINHGDLIGAITYQVAPDGESAFVGVLRQAQRKSDQPGGSKGSMVNIAAVHEFGATVRVTDKMRAYLRGRGFPLKPSTTHLTVPARPYIAPTFAAEQERVAEIMRARFAKLLSG